MENISSKYYIPKKYNRIPLPTPEVETNTLGFTSDLCIALTSDCVVLIRLAFTVCWKPGVHRLVRSSTF